MGAKVRLPDWLDPATLRWAAKRCSDKVTEIESHCAWNHQLDGQRTLALESMSLFLECATRVERRRAK